MAGLAAIDAPVKRPYTIANFIASTDGRVTVGGRSGALGDPGDRALFNALREQVDAVLAGTGTLAAERYGRLIKSADARARRIAAGRDAEPLACVISKSGSLPLGIPLFDEPEARIAVFSPTEPDLSGTRAQVRVLRTPPASASPLSDALTTLRTELGVRTLLCEGGPTLMRSLLAEGLLDELFLTRAPKLVGGGGPGFVAAPELPELVALRLLLVARHGDTLYLRYALARG